MAARVETSGSKVWSWSGDADVSFNPHKSILNGEDLIAGIDLRLHTIQHTIFHSGCTSNCSMSLAASAASHTVTHLHAPSELHSPPNSVGSHPGKLYLDVAI